MAVVRISPNVYNVGVLNPFIRKTSISKECEYGTSYNSYFIDDRKNVLIDVADGAFVSDFMYNLGLVADIGAIDYLILNRVLPCYEKTIERLLQSSPNTVVVCTAKGKEILDNILNVAYNCVIVENGDKLNLGRSLLEFIIPTMAPTPDTMCTYFENDGVIFSGSLLGCDFCEPAVIDEDMIYTQLYKKEAEKYYNFYFRKYPKQITNIVNLLKEKHIYKIAPLNGPVLSDMVNDIMDMYEVLSSKGDNSTENAVVLYASSTGYTKVLAQAIEKTFADNGLNCRIINVADTSVKECVNAVEQSTCLCVGSCTINGGIPSSMWNFLGELNFIDITNKNSFVFGSYGWSGEAVDVISDKLKNYGAKITVQPFKVCMKPTEKDIDALIDIVKKVINK